MSRKPDIILLFMENDFSLQIQYKIQEQHCIVNQTQVTGGNKGIGFAIVKGLCEKFNGAVYLTARSVERGEAAINELKDQGFSPLFHQLDITDQASLNTFKKFISEKHGGIDLLVNNAAILYKEDAPEPLSEQAEITIKVNYYDLLRTCDTLFPLLRKHARVVHLSSSAGHLSNIPSVILRARFSDVNLTIEKLSNLINSFIKDVKEGRHEAKGWGKVFYVPYAVSKVGVNALTIIQQRHFDEEKPNRNIIVNCVHPGYVDTDMTSHTGPLTIEEGARSPLFVALGNHRLRGKFVWSNSEVVDFAAPTTPSLY